MLIKYTDKELDLCARLMRAEALAEGDLGMLMVGNVIVNRAIANCLDFKDIRSIRDVVYQNPGGFVGTNSSLFNSGSATSKEKDLANAFGFTPESVSTALIDYINVVEENRKK